MNQLQAAMMTNALERIYSYVAGDTGLWVDSSGTQTPVTFLWYDSGGPGLVLDSAGATVNGARDALWRKKDIARWNITIDSTGYLLDSNGNRWDLFDKGLIELAMVPMKGIHNFVGYRFRLSVELNKELHPVDDKGNALDRTIAFVDE